jgi:hypothetical protein
METRKQWLIFSFLVVSNCFQSQTRLSDLLRLLRKDSLQPTPASQTCISGSVTEGDRAGNSGNAASVEVYADTSLSGFPQVWILSDEIERLRKRVDLVIERTMRELLKFRTRSFRALLYSRLVGGRYAPRSRCREARQRPNDRYVDVIKKPPGL